MKKLGVIFGGMSTEHDVSVVSGTAVIQNLDKSKYDITAIYIDLDGDWYLYNKKAEEIEMAKLGVPLTNLEKIENPFEILKEMDKVFPVLHGLYGEDGTIQGMLEMLKVPYVGCGVLASSVCMDKVYTKIILEKANINQTEYVYIKKTGDNYIYVDSQFNEFDISVEEIAKKTIEKLGLPVFVKPSNSGSSVGIKKAKTEEELIDAIKYAGEFDRKILVEREVIAREIECAVMGFENVEASCVGEIMPAEEFYSFDSKYNNAESLVTIPAKIDESVAEKIRKTAIKAYKAVDAKGLARVDFFVEKGTNKIILNEINTMPGFTSISMYPQLWAKCGKPYSELLDKLIEI